MITKEQAIDILEKFDFFQGQRAGRELWNDKPFEVQEQDIKDFARDVALLKEYIADVVPKSEVENIFAEIETCMKDFEDDDDGYLLKKCEFEFFMREIKEKYAGQKNG